MRYSAFGVPYTLPLGDSNGDGSTNLGTDDAGICFDWDLDGDVDSSDTTIVESYDGFTYGRGFIAMIGGTGGDSRKGYAGYEHDGVFTTTCHVRNRVVPFGQSNRRIVQGASEKTIA